MRTVGWSVVGLICWATAAPAVLSAQDRDTTRETTREEVDNYARELLHAIIGPNWNIGTYAGPATNGRYLLQRPDGAATGDPQRALKGEGGFVFGASAGVDILVRHGLRLSYTYTSHDLAFRDDSGDDSEALDLEGLGDLNSHVAAIEILRYLLPPRAKVTPYAVGGLIGSWWKLDTGADTSAVQGTTLLRPAGGGTEFRLGVIGGVGLKVKVTDRFDMRLEMASSSVGNPFSGGDSFRALGGTTIDEPGRVGRTDFRLAAVYSFAKPKPLPRPAANR
jgi:hypothetical protein